MPTIFREEEIVVEGGDLWRTSRTSRALRRPLLREGKVHPDQPLRLIAPFLADFRR